MYRASITETKNRLSALLDLVRKGETVVIEDRGVGIAVLAPINGHPVDTDDDRLARLERKGIIRRGTGQLPPDFFKGKRPRIDGVLDALLEERRTGR